MATGFLMGMVFGVVAYMFVLSRTRAAVFYALYGALRANADDRELLNRLMHALLQHTHSPRLSPGWCPLARRLVRETMEALEAQIRQNEERLRGGREEA